MTNIQWAIPCNVKFYNVVAAFDIVYIIDWKQSQNLKNAKKEIFFIYTFFHLLGVLNINV
ncbi:hypothetical protein BUY23_08115 [Staphylococcus cohnii]|nr:hypothetical protein BUY23_08115 [Staphylococcus cohnii]